uniref:Uncharacterized protein n=1 Tax=Bursaphelenchus xylophilus TaxID=6326 RepID=A0A1I7SU48_BURXY
MGKRAEGGTGARPLLNDQNERLGLKSVLDLEKRKMETGDARRSLRAARSTAFPDLTAAKSWRHFNKKEGKLSSSSARRRRRGQDIKCHNQKTDQPRCPRLRDSIMLMQVMVKYGRVG